MSINLQAIDANLRWRPIKLARKDGRRPAAIRRGRYTFRVKAAYYLNIHIRECKVRALRVQKRRVLLQTRVTTIAIRSKPFQPQDFTTRDWISYLVDVANITGENIVPQ